MQAARLNWSEIDPSIFGTLFERGLDPDKRSQLGAHYTDREKIRLLVEPVIVQPLQAEWEGVKAQIAAQLAKARASKNPAIATKARKAAQDLHNGFLERLRQARILDPACGSGNFLYLALLALKDLEHRVNLDAEALGLDRQFPSVGPECAKGIEINPYAAELARVTVWIGEIQWMRRNGFEVSREPILRSLDTIECRDALVNPDGSEAASSIRWLSRGRCCHRPRSSSCAGRPSRAARRTNPSNSARRADTSNPLSFVVNDYIIVIGGFLGCMIVINFHPTHVRSQRTEESTTPLNLSLRSLPRARLVAPFSYRASNYSIKIRIAMYHSTRELYRACNRSSTVSAVRPTTVIRCEGSPRRMPHRIRKTDGLVNLIEVE